MLSTIPVNEMAETLRVLAGDNAASAARHFTKRSYDLGDVASAVLWSSIVQMLNEPRAAAAAEPEFAAVAPFDESREGLAFYGVRYEEVDAETLAREEAAADSTPFGHRDQVLIEPVPVVDGAGMRFPMALDPARELAQAA